MSIPLQVMMIDRGNCPRASISVIIQAIQAVELIDRKLICFRKRPLASWSDQKVMFLDVTALSSLHGNRPIGKTPNTLA